MNGWKYQYSVGPAPNTRAERNELVAKIDEMSAWCQEHIVDHWGQNGRIFCFLLEEDYMMFLLRWQ